MNIGEKIKARRLALGMTTTELGKLIGVQSSAISKYESGRVDPKASTVQALAIALGVTPVTLLSDEEVSEQDRLVSAYWAAEPVYREVALEVLEQHPSKKAKQSLSAG